MQSVNFKHKNYNTHTHTHTDRQKERKLAEIVFPCVLSQLINQDHTHAFSPFYISDPFSPRAGVFYLISDNSIPLPFGFTDTIPTTPSLSSLFCADRHDSIHFILWLYTFNGKTTFSFHLLLSSVDDFLFIEPLVLYFSSPPKQS